MHLDTIQLSKFLSFILRHKPESIGVIVDPQGWTSVDELINRSSTAGTTFSREDLIHVVNTSEKKRFSLSENGLFIRAAQGHSIPIDLHLVPQKPPPILYHGTATRFMESILLEGLKPQARRQVHLSADEATALQVGQRYGKPVILTIEAIRMHSDGFKFFLADNDVWLTDQVPRDYLVS
jgi:putative RNA 2'-phosphotransferase